MNESQNLQPSPNTVSIFPAACFTGELEAAWTDPIAASVASVSLVRFQQNTSRKERLLYSEHIEMVKMSKCGGNGTDEETGRIPVGSISVHKDHHAVVGELLGVVAHKWRQPLNTIAMIIHNLADARKFGELTDELMEHSESRAIEQIHLLSRTLDDFRAFLDPDTTTEHFDPLESVKTVVARLSGWFTGTSTIRIRADRSCADLQAAGCQHAFERVIVNLLCNANDAIEELQHGIDNESGGVITVSMMCVEEHIIISVEDNGGGIDESHVGHIFEPYFTTKQKESGFGMGLYLSRLVIENSMNGKIWFDIIPGGARFSILLPVQALMGKSPLATR